ncbi:hypothetical protein [Nocardioides sp. zg-DK7169]|uniref:hypothetical protein n=1 Tax=Nocardioides sp. zg-DK7169 TaxID=2736600 RepID=UPI0015534580|nr:hypothetical protein [Nocardioides sp. zg-DK7169]NPC95266.1 hypothetical protein [Nocardioides sp. zg-DK7169]
MDLLLTLRLAAVLAPGALVAWLAALLLTLSAGSPTATVLLRTLLTAVILVLLTRLVMRGAYDGPGLVGRAALAGLLAYLVSPAAWAGRALLGQLLVDPGPASYAIDLVVWVALVAIAARTAAVRAPAVAPAPYRLG